MYKYVRICFEIGREMRSCFQECFPSLFALQLFYFYYINISVVFICSLSDGNTYICLQGKKKRTSNFRKSNLCFIISLSNPRLL